MMINSEVQKPDDATLILRRTLKASPARAFQVWTSPEHIKQWMRPDPEATVPNALVDLRVGGKFRLQMKMADGEFFTAVGEFKEVTPPERLVYTWDWEKDGGGDEFGEPEGKTSLITVEFFPRDGRTEMVLTHTRFATTASRDSHAKGWDTLTASFAQQAEKES